MLSVTQVDTDADDAVESVVSEQGVVKLIA